MANLTPITHSELRAELAKGRVSFAFKKLDGTLRLAEGTTQLELVPESSRPAGKRPSPESVVTFWDLEKEEWRCVSAEKEVFIKPLTD